MCALLLPVPRRPSLSIKTKTSLLTCPCSLLAGTIKPPKPHSLDIWRCCWYSGPRILQRLPFLLRLHRPDYCPLLHHPGCAHVAQGRPRHVRHEPVLQVIIRVLDGRAVRWAGGVHIDVDVILRFGTGIIVGKQDNDVLRYTSGVLVMIKTPFEFPFFS
jgi:hypothetical protein